MTMGQVCLPSKECDLLNSIPLICNYILQNFFNPQNACISSSSNGQQIFTEKPSCAPNIHRPLQRLHPGSSISSLPSAVLPTTPRQHLPSQSKALVVSLLAQKFQKHPTASNITSGLGFFQQSGFNLLLRSVFTQLLNIKPKRMGCSPHASCLHFVVHTVLFTGPSPSISTCLSSGFKAHLKNTLPSLPRWILRF